MTLALLVLPMTRAVSGFAADACAGTAGDAGSGCSDNIVKQKPKTYKYRNIAQ